MVCFAGGIVTLADDGAALQVIGVAQVGPHHEGGELLILQRSIPPSNWAVLPSVVLTCVPGFTRLVAATWFSSDAFSQVVLRELRGDATAPPPGCVASLQCSPSQVG